MSPPSFFATGSPLFQARPPPDHPSRNMPPPTPAHKLIGPNSFQPPANPNRFPLHPSSYRPPPYLPAYDNLPVHAGHLSFADWEMMGAIAPQPYDPDLDSQIAKILAVSGVDTIEEAERLVSSDPRNPPMPLPPYFSPNPPPYPPHPSDPEKALILFNPADVVESPDTPDLEANTQIKSRKTDWVVRILLILNVIVWGMVLIGSLSGTCYVFEWFGVEWCGETGMKRLFGTS